MEISIRVTFKILNQSFWRITKSNYYIILIKLKIIKFTIFLYYSKISVLVTVTLNHPFLLLLSKKVATALALLISLSDLTLASLL